MSDEFNAQKATESCQPLFSPAMQLVFSRDLTLLLVLAQIEFALGDSARCSMLCDAILTQGESPARIKAFNMKGDICRHFCQIDQAFFYYQQAVETSCSRAIIVEPTSERQSGVSHSLSSMGDIYMHQGKMREAILLYERALMRSSDADENLNFEYLESA